ncbi:MULTISPECIES: NUDIX domain-containing protein [Catenuloplanes]|uniref:8-oxo-dGTP pyrophosphatase MutT (NUDIX family)/DNA-binding transcriptional regulator YhcF (GntR family) n=1 Tax=Catenuloplanes niger TaxID=587534 RepID=A0AAE4CSR5_9ACTN|nr:NUDIX domain-containing protein [Catenuloplanes niger]MDR7323305.1 8-oxo-dGTP pyrophosphatase MutT (NUDIX family)/DNA-binding transcriptional regulator YhcF (GntR family) [Catenuloplanes niger]
MITPDRRGAAYQRLAGILRDRIACGSLPPGRRVPSEKDLHDEFGLARETVRRALAILRQEGLIEVRHGHGTFVVDAPPTAELTPGDSLTATAAITVTRASGRVETYPAGTRLTVGPRPRLDRPAVAAAVVVDAGHVLLIRRSVPEGPLSWQFPAGEIEPGEVATQAAAREAREETGVLVRPVRPLGRRVHPTTGRSMHYVLCDLIGGSAHPADPDEVAETAWCDRAALADRVPYPLFGPVQEHLDRVLD